jgi:hypothetical protein
MSARSQEDELGMKNAPARATDRMQVDGARKLGTRQSQALLQGRLVAEYHAPEVAASSRQYGKYGASKSFQVDLVRQEESPTRRRPAVLPDEVVDGVDPSVPFES